MIGEKKNLKIFLEFLKFFPKYVKTNFKSLKILSIIDFVFNAAKRVKIFFFFFILQNRC